MAEKRDRRPRNEEHERDLIDEGVTDTSDEDDERFEDIENEEEDDDLDHDVIDEEASGEDRHFTREIGSEGGSAGRLEERRAQYGGIARGSQATETGRPSSDVGKTKDRRPGRP